ncbi:MAG: NB-ARC domain-containing protein, partial [Nocardioides sp.]
MIDLAALLLDPGVRLVTLTGAGGAGKTRLAIATAREVVTAFHGGVYFVALAAITNAENLWRSVCEALDLPPDGRTPEAFCAQMAGRHALLVLDNIEQIEGADRAVATLLQQAPDLAILATSRRPLHLTHEHQYAVGPLPLPVTDTLEEAEASPAVQLFVDRAKAVRSSFALDADCAAEVVAICRHLDGLPLAIELAAARSKLLGPRALVSRLDQVLDLRGTGADRPSRQQALRETIDWSYRLLRPPEQAVFRRLGVFAGGAGLDGLSAVCS